MALFQLYASDPQVQSLYDVKGNYPSDSGFNLFFPETLELKKGETVLIDLGVSGAFFENGERLGHLLVPRSSIGKTPLRLSNSIGIIDKMYTGHYKVMVDVKADFVVVKGTSLFQICLPSLAPFPTHVINAKQELTAERGEGGFGSTDNFLASRMKEIM